MKVLIIGCGYVGQCLAEQLVRQGDAVYAVCRSSERQADLRAAQVVPLLADVTKPESLAGLGVGYDWVVNCVSASGGGPREYQKVYVQGNQNLVSWLSTSPPKRFVYTSSTSVYGQLDCREVDESSATDPSTESGRDLLEAERVLLSAAERGFPAVVLRLAGIYGPGRTYWAEQIRAGAARIGANPDRFVNMIHRDDAAGSIIAALERGRTGLIYNVVDNEPVPLRLLLKWLSSELHTPPPVLEPGAESVMGKRGQSNKRVSNLKLRTELGYKLKFPTFREGYSAGW